jgi:hypothetical protein
LPVPPAAERGQAAIETALLWATIAALAAALGVGLVRSGLPSVIAAAVRPHRPLSVDARAAQILEYGLTGAPGAPSLLAARALLTADLGATRADVLLRGRLLARLAVLRGLEGSVDVSRLATPGAGLRLRAEPAGRPVVVGIATADDEPTPAGVDLRALDGSLPDAVGAALVHGAPAGLERAAHLISHAASAFDVASAVLTRLRLEAPGPGPGERAGDVVFCRPYLAWWVRAGRQVYTRPMGALWRVAVLREGLLIADRIVTRHAC